MSSSSRKTILINYKNEDIRIAWYPGTSDAALRDTIREALRIPPDSLLVLTDDHGAVYAINQHLPDLLYLHAELRTLQNEPLIDDMKGSPYGNANSATSFRGELLKFERISAHLANERTWLAWVRTALSTLSCSFAFLSLSNTGYFEILLYILGSLFCLSVLFVYATGWLRYTRVKLILGLSFKEMKNRFDRIGIHWVSRIFGVLFIATSVLYWIGVFIDIKD